MRPTTLRSRSSASRPRALPTSMSSAVACGEGESRGLGTEPGDRALGDRAQGTGSGRTGVQAGWETRDGPQDGVVGWWEKGPLQAASLVPYYRGKTRAACPLGVRGARDLYGSAGGCGVRHGSLRRHRREQAGCRSRAPMPAGTLQAWTGFRQVWAGIGWIREMSRRSRGRSRSTATAGRTTGSVGAQDSSATLGFEARLWAAANALRGSMDAAECKHVVPGLTFLEYIEQGDSFLNARFPDLKADYIMANPPFDMKSWGGEHLREDRRWRFSVPRAGNANFAWVQHMIGRLAPTGLAGFVLASGSTSSYEPEGEIRKNIVEADLVDCMVARPDKLFYSTQIPACLWFPGAGQERTPARRKKTAPPARPARRGALHRCPEDGTHGGRGRVPGRSRLLQERQPRADPQARLCADAWAVCGHGIQDRRR